MPPVAQNRSYSVELYIMVNEQVVANNEETDLRKHFSGTDHRPGHTHLATLCTDLETMPP